MRAVIHSKKHFVQVSLETVAAGAINTHVIMDAVEPAAVSDTDEIVEGASVKAVFVEDWLRTADTAGGSFVYIIEKASGGINNPTAVEMAALGDYNNKKNILFTSMGLLNDQDADATPVMRGWVKIPKSKQRFGLGDQLRITIFAQSLDVHRCGFQTYKEYT